MFIYYEAKILGPPLSRSGAEEHCTCYSITSKMSVMRKNPNFTVSFTSQTEKKVIARVGMRMKPICLVRTET